jgi:hypothetical protein
MLLGHVLLHFHKSGQVFYFTIVVLPPHAQCQLVSTYFYSIYFGPTDLTVVLNIRK